MNCLLDTHVFLWYINADVQLSTKMRETIEDKRNNVYLSVVSIWESVIKSNIGKLDIPKPVPEYINNKRRLHEIGILNIIESNLYPLESLPDFHKDPFDRLLISQAIDQDLVLLTDDQNIKKYNIKIIQ